MSGLPTPPSIGTDRCRACEEYNALPPLLHNDYNWQDLHHRYERALRSVVSSHEDSLRGIRAKASRRRVWEWFARAVDRAFIDSHPDRQKIELVRLP